MILKTSNYGKNEQCQKIQFNQNLKPQIMKTETQKNENELIISFVPGIFHSTEGTVTKFIESIASIKILKYNLTN